MGNKLEQAKKLLERLVWLERNVEIHLVYSEGEEVLIRSNIINDVQTDLLILRVY